MHACVCVCVGGGGGGGRCGCVSVGQSVAVNKLSIKHFGKAEEER